MLKPLREKFSIFRSITLNNTIDERGLLGKARMSSGIKPPDLGDLSRRFEGAVAFLVIS